jgi:hypothetical protein
VSRSKAPWSAFLQVADGERTYRRFGVRVSLTRFALGGIIRAEDRGIMMVDVSISGLPMVDRDLMAAIREDLFLVGGSKGMLDVFLYTEENWKLYFSQIAVVITVRPVSE